LKREKERRCSRGEEGNERVKNVHEQMIHLNLNPGSTAKEGSGARGKGGRSTTPVSNLIAVTKHGPAFIQNAAAGVALVH
jgi:hypothetical protein